MSYADAKLIQNSLKNNKNLRLLDIACKIQYRLRHGDIFVKYDNLFDDSNGFIKIKALLKKV